MTPLMLMLATTPFSPVRAEPVEARDQSAAPATRPSTSSERTEDREQTPIDAERAFAADAKAIGQWTAFRKWSADDATMFVPQPVNAHEFLKDRKDPPKAIDWWPTASYISCDGTLAANTGGWKRPDGSVGFFTTIWQLQKSGGWKWVADGGDTLETPRARPMRMTVVRASCANVKPPAAQNGDARYRAGMSLDGSLVWESAFNATGHTRVFGVDLWDGKDHRTVIEDLINVK